MTLDKYISAVTLGEELNTCISNCTEDKYCEEFRSFLEDKVVNRTCANGSLPLDAFGTCADNSAIGCYFSQPIPAGIPTFAFPQDQVAFCFDNR